MVTLKIASSTSSNLTDNLDDVTIDPVNTDAATGADETSYQHANWSQYFGYYKSVPELKKAIDMKAVWTVGNGFKADPYTTVILDHIVGWGTDTFNSILKNMLITCQIIGDAFAQIIRDPQTQKLINLKPLDAGQVKIITDRKGFIKRYEVVSKITGASPQKLKPEEIFHLSKDRVADEIHGVGIVESVEQIILASNESFVDMKKLMHRHVKPIMAFKLDTDDTTKINSFVSKMDEVVNKGENIYVPKDTVEYELISVPSNATLNPLPWREHLKDKFYQAAGIPQIILGSSGEFTESTAKIAYLAFEQSVKDEQLLIESNIWNQLQLRIELEFPASLRNEMLSDENKDSMQGMEFQPSDVTAGVGR